MNLEGPAPGNAEIFSRPAHLGDISEFMSDVDWLWINWIPIGRLSAVAASEGIGKTRFAMDLARRVWFGLPWPDGQPPSFPPGTPTLWICSDGQQSDLVEIARGSGMPLDSVYFNTEPAFAFGGTEIDDEESRVRLERNIAGVKPGLVFIDSLTNATSGDLCKAVDVKLLLSPLRDICQRSRTTVVLLLHVSKDGEALGRRVKGLTRTILSLDRPDPEESGRLKLWVSKSYSIKPPALGVTMGERGNEYDNNLPRPPEVDKGGRPPEAKGKATAFLLETLGNSTVTVLRFCSFVHPRMTGRDGHGIAKSPRQFIEPGKSSCPRNCG